MRILLLFFFFVICYSSDINLEEFKKEIKEFFKSEIKNKTEYLLQVIKNDQANLKKELNEKIEKSLKEIKKDEKDSYSTVCGDNSWIQYKDEKCIKVFNSTKYLVNYTSALEFCKKQDSTGNLIVIKTKEEQQFIEKYLFESNKFEFDDENIWIGAKNNSKRYIWEDNTSLNYTNWSNDLKDDESYKCAAIITEKKNKGKWTNFKCHKNSLIFCQKSQQWTFKNLKENFLQSKKELQYATYKLQQNPVPIGFIYVQLPKEKSPTEIWPWMTWKDVTSGYAGLFFRAEGGGSMAFNKIQEENSPRLVKVVKKLLSDVSGLGEAVVDKGILSKGVYSGDYAKESYYYTVLQFLTSDGEIRPRNIAIRIWKRTG